MPGNSIHFEIAVNITQFFGFEYNLIGLKTFFNTSCRALTPFWGPEARVGETGRAEA